MAGLARFIFVSYLLLGIHFWYTRWHRTFILSKRQFVLEHLIVAVILSIHAYAIFHYILRTGYFSFGAAPALTLIAWIALMSYWFATFIMRLEGIQPILFFISALCVISSLFPFAQHHIVLPSTPLFKTHFILAILAYGLMLYALWLAILIWLIDYQLHYARRKNLLHRLPSLLTLERYLFSSIAIGFVLLTLAIISGFIFPHEAYNNIFYFSHQVTCSVLSWCAFAILLWGRLRRGWRGRFAVNWVIIGFILLILGYIGSSWLIFNL